MQAEISVGGIDCQLRTLGHSSGSSQFVQPLCTVVGDHSDHPHRSSSQRHRDHNRDRDRGVDPPSSENVTDTYFVLFSRYPALMSVICRWVI
jgi:hypothetical protein